MTCFASRARAAALLLALALAAGCGGEPKPVFLATDITGSAIQPELRLTDHTGRERTLADFRGKVVVVFFGYTHCPDICPTTMAEAAAAMRQIGPAADKVQVLFVTVDPERDTSQLLAKYVPSFHPSFLGLRGDPEATARTAASFKVIYQKQAGAAPDSYTMDHSSGSYVFDARGRLRLYVGYGQAGRAYVHDIPLLLVEKE